MSLLIPDNKNSATRGTLPLENQNGFTLVELLVAILLMTVGIFAVIAMQTTSMNANSIAMRLSVASALAQEALEDILSWSPETANLRTSGKYDYDLDPKTAGNEITIPGAGTYKASYTTTIGPPTVIPPGVTKVTVTVTGSGRSVTVTGFKRTI